MPPLLRPIHAVARITQARHDVAVIIEMAIDGGGPDMHIGMGFGEFLNALGRGEQTHKTQIGNAPAF